MSRLATTPEPLLEAWVALRHGGNLLSPMALEGLPEPPPAPRNLADRLRSALVARVARGEERGARNEGHGTRGEGEAELLDVVLEDGCRLQGGWDRAPGAADAEKLLDGTVLRPRRIWRGSSGEGLAVFTSTAARLGVGRGRRPLAQVVEYLRRRAWPLGLLTNGSQWRLCWADPDSLASVEWEADRWLAAAQLSGELAVLRRVLSPAALRREGESSPLLAAIRDTRRGQAQLSRELGERVRRAVEALLCSREPLLGPAWSAHGSGDLYVAACHFVMRLVVTLFAEARELLPTDNPVYHQAYGLRGLLDQLDRLTPERRRARQVAWPRLLALFRLLHQGSPHPALTLPAYGGDLFRPGDAEGDGVQRALALLEALPAPPDDDVVHRILVLLTRTTQRVREGAVWRTVAAPVDFTELTSEYIGILYEGLLDYELQRAGADPVVFLNLGDQPALPLDRLEGMDDKALLALVERGTRSKERGTRGEEGGEGEDEEDDEEIEDEEGPDDEAGEVAVEPDAPLEEADLPSDARAAARARALAWARRAALAGKLVSKPRGQRSGSAEAFAVQLDAAARQLIADLKLPGELYLVRWGGTRKGAGTFYTRPQLTLPTVRRTLEPLLFEERGTRNEERGAGDEDRGVSGVDGLAEGGGALQGGVSGDTRPAGGGAVRADQPAPSGRGVGAEQHRRGPLPDGDGGLSASSPDGPRLGRRGGDAAPPLRGAGAAACSGGGVCAGVVHGDQQDVEQPDHQAARPLIPPLVPRSSFLVPLQPERLLGLKVCDPAMGSGSFLVAALRVLTAAVVESLHVHGRIARDNGKTTVDCALLPEADRSLPTEGFDERLEAVVRRAVVEHCLYGVDLDPLAVELARVALWVETLDRRLPFTFLDHKLRCGDSLVGTWLDRFRDYPLLCFDRQSPDLKYKGVHHPADVWHRALKARRSEAIAEQVDLLTGQLRLQGAATSDEELRAAVERIRRLYRELRAVPAGRPDERARIWRERIQTDAALARVREAFDTWCALWFWPLDQLDVMPLPSDLHAPGDAARAVVQQVRARRRFFHWELEFPDVFTEEGAGFDAVVGNPPWETQKPLSQEFFSNHDPLYRTYAKQDALRIQAAIFDSHPTIEAEWLVYVGEFKDRGNFVKHAAEPFGDGKVAGHSGGDISLSRGKEGAVLHRSWRGRRTKYKGTSDPKHAFLHQGSADLNSYKMFIEQAHALLRLKGQLGLVVPSGVYSDHGSSSLRRLLLDGCVWRALYVFQNERKFFRDVHHSQKQCVILATKSGLTSALPVVFRLGPSESPREDDIPVQLESAWSPLMLDRELIERFSPGSCNILEISSIRNLSIIEKMYAHGMVVGDNEQDGWCIKYSTEFHMTGDSRLFILRDKAEIEGYKADDYGRWVNDYGNFLLPLYEGRMIGQFDFSSKAWLSGKGRTAIWEAVPWSNKLVGPQYLMSPEHLGMANAYAKVAFMDVSAAINTRTAIATLVDRVPCGHSLATFDVNGDLLKAAGVCMLMNSFAFDNLIRQRVVGLHLTLHYLAACPLVPPNHIPLAVVEIVLRLSAGHERFASWWSGTIFPSAKVQRAWRRLWALTPHERLRLRCMLDAIVAVLYGLDRDDFAWILKDCDHPRAHLSDKAFCRKLDPKGFWRVDKTADPELRHTVLSLAAFDDLQRSIAAAGGDRDAGIQAFCDQHDGDGWMLPETLCLADLGLTRTVNPDDYDDRARVPQPVRSRMGERFLDWQLAQTPEESWAECERHAQAILEGRPEVGVSSLSEKGARSEHAKRPLERPPAQGSLFDIES